MDSTGTPQTPSILLAARFLLSGDHHPAPGVIGKRNPEEAESPRGEQPQTLPYSTQHYLPDSPWRHAARWLPLWGLAIGIAYAIIYRGAWKWFGEYQKIRLLPPLAILVAEFAFFGYRQIAAAVAIIDRRAAGIGLGLPGVLAAILITLLKFAMLIILPAGAVIWPADWRQNLGPLYPEVIYRPLLLMPLWGRWGTMLALCIGRVSPGGSDRLRQMASGIRLKEIIGWWFAIGVLTVVYASPMPRHLTYGVLIALAVMVITYLANFALARQANGQTENTVAATGLVAELAFLGVYLPVARAIYWY